jgi:germination protein M
MKKYGIWLCIMFMLVLTACGKEQKATDETVYQIYEVNKEETKVASREITTTETDTEKLLGVLIEELEKTPEDTENRAAITEAIQLQSSTVADESANLNFGVGYYEQSLTGEILTRAAIVRTLTQIPDVNYVSFLVDGSALLNNQGAPVGVMTADQFIDNSGNEINTEEKVTLVLYLANENGNKLKKVTREVVYSSNISLDKLVMEQLITGVQDGEEAYPTINPATKVVSVTVSDGTCYVNLDKEFLTQIYKVDANVTIYSIVNSLVELSDVNRVQISINGETDLSYKESIPLATVFERNLELVEQ